MADEIIILFISIVFLVVIFLVLLFAGKRMRQTPYLMSALAFVLVVAFFYFWAAYYFVLTGEQNQLLADISLIPLVFIFFLFYMYFEALSNARPPLNRVITMSGLLLFLVTLNVLNSLNFFTIPHLFALFGTFSYCYGTASFAFGVSVFRKALAIYRKTAIKIDLGVFSVTVISTIILQISGIVSFFVERPSPLAIQFFLVGISVLIGALGLLLVNSMINGDYIYYIPHPIQAIMLYNGGGVLVYEQTFESGGQKLLKGPELISGILTAFSAFFKEILGTESAINYINTKKSDFYFEQLPEDAGTLVVVSSSANQIMIRSMKKLVRALPPTLVESIKDFKGKMLIEEFDKLIKVYFPYLNPLATNS